MAVDEEDQEPVEYPHEHYDDPDPTWDPRFAGKPPS